MYDIIYELDNTDIYLALNEEIKGYLLIWKGMRRYGIHIWGEAGELIGYIPQRLKAVIQIYNKNLLNNVLEYLRNENIEVKEYLDMAVEEYVFKPYMSEKAKKLSENDVEAFSEIKKAQGMNIDMNKCKELITKWRYYGVYVNSKLVSIACAYVRMPEVWVIGDVFTHPDHRGKGYAKIATSAITRDAITSGAKALLHVEKIMYQR